MIGIIVLISCYFLPTMIALQRGKHRVGSVAVINLFLGWTVIGWLLALMWAPLEDEAPSAAIKR